MMIKQILNAAGSLAAATQACAAPQPSGLEKEIYPTVVIERDDLDQLCLINVVTDSEHSSSEVFQILDALLATKQVYAILPTDYVSGSQLSFIIKSPCGEDARSLLGKLLDDQEINGTARQSKVVESPYVRTGVPTTSNGLRLSDKQISERALAFDLTYNQLDLDEVTRTQLCTYDKSFAISIKYGVPILYVHLDTDTLIYLFNQKKADDALGRAVLSKAAEQCDSNTPIPKGRQLNQKEIDILAKLFAR